MFLRFLFSLGLFLPCLVFSNELFVSKRSDILKKLNEAESHIKNGRIDSAMLVVDSLQPNNEIENDFTKNRILFFTHIGYGGENYFGFRKSFADALEKEIKEKLNEKFEIVKFTPLGWEEVSRFSDESSSEFQTWLNRIGKFSTHYNFAVYAKLVEMKILVPEIDLECVRIMLDFEQEIWDLIPSKNKNVLHQLILQDIDANSNSKRLQHLSFDD